MNRPITWVTGIAIVILIALLVAPLLKLIGIGVIIYGLRERRNLTTIIGGIGLIYGGSALQTRDAPKEEPTRIEVVCQQPTCPELECPEVECPEVECPEVTCPQLSLETQEIEPQEPIFLLFGDSH